MLSFKAVVGELLALYFNGYVFLAIFFLESNLHVLLLKATVMFFLYIILPTS